MSNKELGVAHLKKTSSDHPAGPNAPAIGAMSRGRELAKLTQLGPKCVSQRDSLSTYLVCFSFPWKMGKKLVCNTTSGNTWVLRPITRIQCWHCTFLQSVDMLHLYVSCVSYQCFWSDVVQFTWIWADFVIWRRSSSRPPFEANRQQDVWIFPVDFVDTKTNILSQNQIFFFLS